jgi:hypothetical protein
MPGEYAELIKSLGLELESMMTKADDGKDDGKTASTADGDADADNKKIQAAADDGKAKSDADCDKDDKMLGKAMTLKMPDGSEIEAFDGTQAIAELTQHNAELREAMTDMQKAFGAAVEVIKALRTQVGEQATMIKAFGDKVSTAVASPSGRRSMVSIIEKLSPAETKTTEQPKATPQSVMMKARALCDAGKAPWEILPRIEAYQGRGMIAPPDLLAHFPDLATPA